MGDLASLSSRAIRGFFFQQLALSPTTWVDGVANLFDSDQASETYNFASHAPVVREWISGRNVKTLTVEGITIKNVPYEGTLEITRLERDRDKTQQVTMRLRDLVRRFGTHWVGLTTGLLNVGATTGLAWDGLSFFNDSHVNLDSGTIDNKITSDIAIPAKPSVGEMETMILEGIEQMLGFKDSEGEPLNEDATQFTIVVPVNWWAALAGALKNQTIIDSSTARTNTLVSLSNFSFEPVATPRLTADDTMYILRRDTASKALIRQEEQKVDLKSQTEGSHIEFTEDIHWHGIDARRAMGYGMFEYAVSIQAI